MTIFLLTPSLNFSLFTAEIFPWAVMLYVFRRRYNKNFLLLSIVLIILSIVSMYSNDGYQVVRQTVAYINILCAFFFVASMSTLERNTFENTIYHFFFGLVVLGILQATNVLQVFDPIFKQFIPRGSLGNLSEWNRGVSLLSSEPSRAAAEFLLLYLIIRPRFIAKKMLDGFVGLYLLFIVQSVMGVGMWFLALSLLYGGQFIKASLFLIGFVLLGLPELLLSGRLARLFEILLTEPTSFYQALMSMGGQRFVILHAVFETLPNNLIGYGIGSWKESSLVVLEQSSLDGNDFSYFRSRFNGEWAPTKPSGFLPSIALDFGLIGFSLSLFLILYGTARIKLRDKLIGMAFLLVGLASGHPYVWIYLALKKGKKNDDITQVGGRSR